jgi:hypothetical protein
LQNTRENSVNYSIKLSTKKVFKNLKKPLTRK